METVTIQVKSETAHRWREIAEREGRAVEAIAAQAAEAGTDALTENGGAREYSQEVARRLAAWHSLDTVTTGVDVDDSRASIYEERGL